MFRLLLLTLAFTCYAEEIVVRTTEGELEVVNVENEFIDQIHQFGKKNEFIVDFKATEPSQPVNVNNRNFYKDPTAKEIDDMRYILTTLGESSLVKIAKAKSSLKKAGDRIDNVHPLQFLKVIFTDEEMKVCAHAISERSWIRDEFIGGFKKTLEEEANRNNLTPEMISTFAEKVGIDPNLIFPAINQKEWKDFIYILIDKIPRKTQTDRYNM